MGRPVSDLDPGRVTEIVLQMIGTNRGRPCPTRRQIMQWTGLPRREVWPFLKSLAERSPPLIEIEERLHDRAGSAGCAPPAATGPAGPCAARPASSTTP